MKNLQKMLIEMVSQQNAEIIPATEIMGSEIVKSVIQGKNEEEIIEKMIDENIGEKLKERELSKQIEKEQNLKPIIIDKDLPPIIYDTIRRENQYKCGSFLLSEIPQYSRIRTNKIVGFEDENETRRLLKELTEMLGIYEPEKKISKLRYFSKRPSLLNTEENIPKPVKNSEIQNSLIKNAEFIPFENKKPGSEISKKTEEKNEIDKFEFDPSQASEQERFYLQKTKEFNEKIRNNPKDIKIWLEYIKLQDNLYEKMNTKYEKQKTERKLAIIEKALNSVENEQKIELILLFLKGLENTESGNFELKNEKWIEYIRKFPYSFKLISQYFNFIISEKNLSATKIREIFIQILQIISKIQSSEIQKYEKLVINLLYEISLIEKYVFFKNFTKK